MNFLEQIKHVIGIQSTSSKVIRVAYGPEALQFGDLYLPEGSGPYPTVVLIHGGFWRVPYGLKLMAGLAEDLAARGFAVWNIEYRRVGDRGGGWPATLLDVARATDYLRVLATSYALDLKRVVPIGHSAGGHLAFWLAARPRIAVGDPLAGGSMKGGTDDGPLVPAGAISLAGVVDLMLGWRLNLGMGAVADLLGGEPSAVPERYRSASPAALLPLGVPTVLVHGSEDYNVPVQVSQAYAVAARAANDQVTLIELPGVEHFAVINPRSAAWARTIEALQELLASVP